MRLTYSSANQSGAVGRSLPVSGAALSPLPFLAVLLWVALHSHSSVGWCCSFFGVAVLLFPVAGPPPSFGGAAFLCLIAVVLPFTH